MRLSILSSRQSARTDLSRINASSAGARAISYQLLGYGLSSTPLFRAAILESGSPPIFPPTDTSSYQASFNAITLATGCDGFDDKLDCLRGLSLEEFNKTASAFKFEPVIDGSILPESVNDSLEKGAFVKVPCSSAVRPLFASSGRFEALFFSPR